MREKKVLFSWLGLTLFCFLFWFMVVFFFVKIVFAGEKYQVYRGYTPQYGDYYDSRGQYHKNYTPKYGDKIKPQGDRLQIYKNYTPDYGDYYDKNGQKYENYVPKYGDKIKRK